MGQNSKGKSRLGPGINFQKKREKSRKNQQKKQAGQNGRPTKEKKKKGGRSQSPYQEKGETGIMARDIRGGGAGYNTKTFL